MENVGDEVGARDIIQFVRLCEQVPFRLEDLKTEGRYLAEKTKEVRTT